MNKKGLFFVNKTIVKKKKIKSIKTFDFLYDKSGKTIKRNRGDFAEFDSSGNMILFEGNRDQGPSVKLILKYDANGNNTGKILYVKGKDKFRFIVKINYIFKNNIKTEHKAYNKNGKLVGKRIYKHDKKGNLIEEAKVDPTTNKIITKKFFTYDNAGNLMEMSSGKIKTIFNYNKKKVNAIHYFSNGQVRIREKYRFDDNDNVIEFFRESGDGSFWDRFEYKIGDQGLPIEKTWSRKEYIIQSPYELTKYKYEYFR